ncbi:hypothetical protein AAC387_Pa01g0154 [Persea americana]
MDSCNSASTQSSSGGEEEFDPRAESISLYNSSNQISTNSILNPRPSSSNHLHPHQHPPLFDSLSNFLHPSPPPPSNTNSFLNLDMAWTRGLPSQPNCTDFGGLIGPSSTAPPISSLQGPNPTNPYMGSSFTMPLPSSRHENGGRPPPPSAISDHPNPTRSSKKRSRASRRAPTTVLTTDTSNFRAMVQEFTGIPAPPFSATSFARARLDLFGTASALRSSLANSLPPPYLLRPFVHKVPLSSSSSSSIFEAVCSSTAGNSISTSAKATCNNTTSASAGNYQLPSDLSLPKQLQQQNLLSTQNPMYSFQSLLQSSPKYPSAQGPSGCTDSQLKMGMLDGFSINHGLVNTHQGSGTLANLIGSDGVSSRSDDHQSWGDGSNGGDQSHLRPFDWNCSNSQRVSTCKMSYTASSSDFHVEKGSENVNSRGEGMVESWICSSD